MLFQLQRLSSIAMLAVACSLATALPARAADYPTKPLRLIIPFGPGGISDALARLVAAKLSERLGQPVVSENKPGAATVVGIMATKNAAPDGYTLLLGGSSGPMNQALDKAVDYHVVNDFEPISIVAEFPFVMVVNPQLPAKNVSEFVAWLKSNPGKASYAIGGIGSSTHFAAEFFLSMTGTTAVAIPFSNAPAVLQSVITGDSQFGFDTPASTKGQVAAGKLRALGVSTLRRTSAMPEVPTIAEGGVPGYNVTGFLSIVAPAKTPKDVVARLNKELTAIMQDQALVDRLKGLGMEPTSSTPEAATRRFADELARWSKLAQERKLQKQ